MKQFTCPKCENNVAEEILCGATASYEFTGVNEDGELEYNGITSTDGGEFSRFQCACCGFVLDGVESVEDLVEWIENQE